MERIIGCTFASECALSVNAQSNDVAYMAGSMLVIYNATKNRQVQFLSSDENSTRAFCSVAYSPNGKYIAAGEVCCFNFLQFF